MDGDNREQEIVDEDDNDNEGNDDETKNNVCAGKSIQKLDYVAKQPRRILACESDAMAAADSLFTVAVIRTKSSEKGSNLSKVQNYVLYDNERVCNGYQENLHCAETGRDCDISTLQVFVHTLQHGSITSTVLDL